MSTFQWRTRALAAGIHLGGCAAIAALAGALVFLVWYPAPYAALAGGQGLFFLIISVDVVMGPLVTFAVFDRRKGAASLRRDLAIVVLLQLAALGYGLHTMFIARPVVMALEGNRFRVVSVVDVLQSELPSAQPEFRRLPLLGPRLVRTAEIPEDKKFEAIRMALAGQDLGTRPSYWRAWDDTGRREALAASQPLSELLARQPAHRQAILQMAADTGLPADQVRFLPVISRFAQAVAFIDGRSGEVAGFAPYDGF